MSPLMVVGMGAGLMALVFLIVYVVLDLFVWNEGVEWDEMWEEDVHN